MHPEKPGTVPVLSCPRCSAQAFIEHSVEVPDVFANRGSRVTFNADGSPNIVKARTLKATCSSGHSIQGPADEYADKSVAAFLAEVEAWNSPCDL